MSEPYEVGQTLYHFRCEVRSPHRVTCDEWTVVALTPKGAWCVQAWRRDLADCEEAYAWYRSHPRHWKAARRNRSVRWVPSGDTLRSYLHRTRGAAEVSMKARAKAHAGHSEQRYLDAVSRLESLGIEWKPAHGLRELTRGLEL